SFWVLNIWVKVPAVPDDSVGFTSALALASILYAGILTASAIVNFRRSMNREMVAKASITQKGRATDLRGGIDLPADFPCAVVSLTPEGRIRAIKGNRSLVAPLRIGDVAAETLAALHPGLSADFIRHGGTVEFAFPNNKVLSACGVQMESGPALIFAPQMRQSNEADLLRERTQFFASLSHDLKTPLNAIIGFADMMKSGLRGPLPESYQDYSEIIHESGQDMLLLVDDILDLAKADAESLKLDLEPIDLAASGLSVLRQLEAQALRQRVTLKFETALDVWALADARAVRQIWQNLVSNAIKYSAPGSEVLFEVGEADNAVFLAVEDFGAGMDLEDLDHIGSPFRQGTNAQGRLGTGLGLAVVKRFADLHGGQVKVETAKGQGTRVEVTFKQADLSDLDDFEKAAQ
ncbi:MAG: HAMP domain-containing sensor histidine kinase, partial [Pseudomonadota bacterium]